MLLVCSPSKDKNIKINVNSGKDFLKEILKNFKDLCQIFSQRSVKIFKDPEKYFEGSPENL